MPDEAAQRPRALEGWGGAISPDHPGLGTLFLGWSGTDSQLTKLYAEENLEILRELSIHCEHCFQGPLCDNRCVCCRAKIRGLFFILFLACAAILAPAACACGALCVCALTPPLSFSPFALPSHPPRARYTYPIALSLRPLIDSPKNYLSEQVWMDGNQGGAQNPAFGSSQLPLPLLNRLLKPRDGRREGEMLQLRAWLPRPRLQLWPPRLQRSQPLWPPRLQRPQPLFAASAPPLPHTVRDSSPPISTRGNLWTAFPAARYKRTPLSPFCSSLRASHQPFFSTSPTALMTALMSRARWRTQRSLGSWRTQCSLGCCAAASATRKVPQAAVCAARL